MRHQASATKAVLVVDDQDHVRSVLVRTLRSLGADAWAAADGPGALALFAHNSAEIDLAVIDLHLPGMDGADVAAALHQIDAALPCCLITGDTTAPLPPGFCCALAKPFLPGQLAALLSSWTRRP
jgi:CheY-like chemotaxis protein